jgi:hypothetical protein
MSIKSGGDQSPPRSFQKSKKKKGTTGTKEEKWDSDMSRFTSHGGGTGQGHLALTDGRKRGTWKMISRGVSLSLFIES